jgi:hypothetical protein
LTRSGNGELRAPKEVTLGGSRPAVRATQGTPEGGGEEGRLLFGYFLLAKQEKVTGRRATPAKLKHRI